MKKAFIFGLCLAASIAFGQFMFGPNGQAFQYPPPVSSGGAPDITTNGLAGWWKFEEGSGTTNSDSSGNSRTATLNSATWTGSGKVGSDSVSFNGTSAYVSVPSFNNTAVGISFWVYPMDGPGSVNAGLVTKYSGGGNRSWIVSWDGTAGSPNMLLSIGDVLKVTTTLTGSSVQAPTNVWLHVGAYFDGEAMAVFTNGVCYGVGGGYGNMDSSAIAVNFGARDNGSVNFFGRLDDVRIYSNAPSPSVFYTLSGASNLTPTNTTSLLNLITDGDSMTAGGNGSPASPAWPLLLKTNVGVSRVFVSNLAVSGQSFLHMLGRQDQMAKLFGASAISNVLVGLNSNDIKLGADDVNAFARCKTWAAAGRAAGHKVAVCTVMKRSDYDGAMESYRVSFNARLITNGLNFADWVIDFAGNTNLDYTLHPENYGADTIHQNRAGCDIMATMVQTNVGW